MEATYRFVDNPNAPEIFYHHLHDVQFINGIARIVPVALRFDGSEIIGEPPVILLMPATCVEPALHLMWERLAHRIVVPALSRIVKRVLAVH